MGHCVWYQDAAEIRSRAYLAYRHYLGRRRQVLEKGDKDSSTESKSDTQEFVVTCCVTAASPDGPLAARR